MNNKQRLRGEHFLFFHDNLDTETVKLDDTESRHMTSVLRLQCGANIAITNGKGCSATAVITTISRNTVAATITSRAQQPPVSPSVTMLLGMPERDAFETVLVNATALGIERIIPVTTDYSQSPWWASSWDKCVERFHQKMVVALKQSKQFFLPQLFAPVNLAQALTMVQGQLLVADSSGIPVFSVLSAEASHDSIVIAIGPPGGFSDEELDLFKTKGFTAVSIAKSRLRTELAATTLLSQIAGHTLAK